MPIRLIGPPISKVCGCYYCISIFREDEIHTYHDNGKTPECPACGIDSVMEFSTCMGVGDIASTLKQAHMEAFKIVGQMMDKE